jgi:hypothetical protein
MAMRLGSFRQVHLGSPLSCSEAVLQVFFSPHIDHAQSLLVTFALEPIVEQIICLAEEGKVAINDIPVQLKD